MAKYRVIKFSNEEYVLAKDEFLKKTHYLRLDSNPGEFFWSEKLSPVCYAKTLDELVNGASRVLAKEIQIFIKER